MLEPLGLDGRAEAVYIALLGNPQSDLEDLAARVDASTEQVRETLDNLAKLSLLRASWEDKGRMRVVPPEVAMEALIAQQRAELAMHQERLEASRAAAARLIADYVAQHDAAEAACDVEPLAGIDEIRDRLTELAGQVGSEVLTFAPGGAHSSDSRAAAQPLDETLLGRGVQIKILFLDSVRNHHATMVYARTLVDLGAEVRTTPSLPVRMSVLDRTTAIVSNTAGNSGCSAVVTKMKGVVTALAVLFDLIWATATPIAENAQRDILGLTPQQRSALKLLASGHTDEAVAKRLGISPRTSRRIASDVMIKLGALSRFQAGYTLGRMGWLDDDCSQAEVREESG